MSDFEFEPCIQCGHRSYFFIQMPFGLLEYCFHHYQVNWPALEFSALHVRMEPVPA